MRTLVVKRMKASSECHGKPTLVLSANRSSSHLRDAVCAGAPFIEA